MLHDGDATLDYLLRFDAGMFWFISKYPSERGNPCGLWSVRTFVSTKFEKSKNVDDIKYQSCMIRSKVSFTRYFLLYLLLFIIFIFSQ